MISIRSGNDHDIEYIANLHHTTWRDVYSKLINCQEQVAKSTVEEWLKLWEARFKEFNHNTNIWIAQDDGARLGFCVTQLYDDNSAEIKYLYVQEVSRGQGVGRLLLNHSIQELKSASQQEIYLYTIRENINARSFYEAMGFQLAKEQNTQTRHIAGSEIHFIDVKYQMQ